MLGEVQSTGKTLVASALMQDVLASGRRFYDPSAVEQAT
jgi:hypothetical protein